MEELSVGEVVRVTIVGRTAEEVDAFRKAFSSDPDAAAVLTLMPEAPDARRQDFGTWELVQEFIVSGVGGATSVGIVEIIRALWKRGTAAGDLPAAPGGRDQTLPGGTPQQQAITVTASEDGVTEIVIHIRRD